MSGFALHLHGILILDGPAYFVGCKGAQPAALVKPSVLKLAYAAQRFRAAERHQAHVPARFLAQAVEEVSRRCFGIGSERSDGQDEGMLVAHARQVAGSKIR